MFVTNGAEAFPALSYAVISIFHFPSVSIGITLPMSIGFSWSLSLNNVFVSS